MHTAQRSSRAFLLVSAALPLLAAPLLAGAPCDPPSLAYEPGSWERPPACPGQEGQSCGDRVDAGVMHTTYLFSGEFYCAATDLRIRGRGQDFIWARKYRSRLGPDTAIGKGWDYSYNIYLEAAGGDLILHDGNTRSDLYTLQSNGRWARDEFFREIELNGNGTYTLWFADTGRWNFAALDGTAAAGRITSSVDRNGNALTFAYDGQGRLVTITDTLGRNITVAYNAGGYISTVTDFAGRQVQYAYYQDADAGGSSGDLKSARSPIVVGTPHGNDFPAGKTTVYTYSKGFADERLNHNLLTITDPKGRRYLSNTYAATAAIDCDLDNDIDLGDFACIQDCFTGSGGGPGAGGCAIFYYDADNDIDLVDLDNFYAAWHGPSQGTLEFDRLVTQVWGNQGPGPANTDRIDVAYTIECPSPANNYANFMTTVNDRVGNVKQFLYDAGNRLVIAREYTGRADADQPTNLAAGVNTPGAPLRPGDPAHFESRWEFNADGLPVRITHPNLSEVLKTYELELDPNAPRRTRGNLREIQRLPGPLGGDQTVIVEQFEYAGGFGGCGCGGNFVTRHVDGRGNQTLHTYDAAGNRVHTTHRIPSIVEDWTYNAFGQETSHTLPPNNSGWRRKDTQAYYSVGPQTGYRQSAVVDSLGFALTTTYEYDARGNTVRKVDPRGFDTLYEYNALDQLVRQRSPLVGGVRYGMLRWYDADDNLVRSDIENRDEQGVLQPNTHFSTISEYEILNHATRVCRESGAAALTNSDLTCAAMPPAERVTTEFEYDANRNRTLARSGVAVAGVDPLAVTQTLCDERDLVFREIRAPGSGSQSTTQYDYDGNRNEVAERHGLEAAPHVTTYTYDGYDRRVTRTDPLSNVTSFNYDANGNRTHEQHDGEQVDVAGSAGNIRLSEISFVYDAMDRRTREDISFFDPPTQTPIGDGFSSTVWVYSDSSQVVSRTTDLAGHVTTYAYDSANRLSLVTDARNNTKASFYDAASNVVGTLETDKSDLGNPDETFGTTFSYDALDRLVQVVDNLGNTDQYAYDSRGNRALYADARGNATRYHYDGRDRLIRTVRDMDGNGPADAWPGDADPDIVTVQSWDNSSRLTAQTDDNGNTTTYQYDALDRRIGVDYADCTSSTTAYDVHDNAVSATDANGTTVANTYDNDSRLLRRDVIALGPGVMPDTTFEDYQYDGLSRLVRAADNDSLVTRAYDSLSDVTTETQQLAAGPLRTILAQYDGERNQTQLIYPGGRRITRTYDALDRPFLVRHLTPAPIRTIATYRYIGPRRLERRDYGGPVVSRFEPDYDGVRRMIRTLHTQQPGGTAIDDRTYAWDPMNNKLLMSRVVPAPLEDRFYAYDGVSRLVQSNTVVVGQPTPTDYVFDGAGNRAIVNGGANPGPYTLDPVLCEPGDFQMNQYTTTPFNFSRLYDNNGNLTDINAGARTFSYDARDRLVQTAGAQTASYRYDCFGRRIEKNVNGTIARFYYDGGELVEEQDAAGVTVATYVYSKGIASRLEMLRGTQRYYFHEDDLGSVIAITNTSGTVVERYGYDDYGARTVIPGGAYVQPTGAGYGYYSDLDPDPAGVQVMADDFQLSQTTNLSALRWWGFYYNGQPADNFTITIWDSTAASTGPFPESPADPVPGLPNAVTYQPTGDLGILSNPLPNAGAVDGQWILEITDWSAQDLGTLSGWQLNYSVGGSPASAGGTGGSIPDGQAGCGNAPGAPLVSQIFLPPGATGPLSVDLYITHTYVGDVRIALIGPGGFSTVLLDRPGASAPGACGSGADFAAVQHPYRWSSHSGGGLPGNLVYQLGPGAPVVRTATAGGVYQYDVALNPLFQAQAGVRYWVSIANNLPGSPVWLWHISTPANNQAAYAPGLGGPWQSQAADLAFVLNPQPSPGSVFAFHGHYLDGESGLYHCLFRYFTVGSGRFLTRDPIGAWADRPNLGNSFAFVGNNPTSRVDQCGLQQHQQATGTGIACDTAQGIASGCLPPRVGAIADVGSGALAAAEAVLVTQMACERRNRVGRACNCLIECRNTRLGGQSFQMSIFGGCCDMTETANLSCRDRCERKASQYNSGDITCVQVPGALSGQCAVDETCPDNTK